MQATPSNAPAGHLGYLFLANAFRSGPRTPPLSFPPVFVSGEIYPSFWLLGRDVAGVVCAVEARTGLSCPGGVGVIVLSRSVIFWSTRFVGLSGMMELRIEDRIDGTIVFFLFFLTKKKKVAPDAGEFFETRDIANRTDDDDDVGLFLNNRLPHPPPYLDYVANLFFIFSNRNASSNKLRHDECKAHLCSAKKES